MRVKQILAALVLALALPAMMAIQAGAQATSSALSGVVRDPSAAVISGAEIVVTNTDTGITRTASTNASGLYRVGELIPGKYQITASMTGFSKETRKDVVLLVGQELNVSFNLQVGGVEQEIVVTGEAPIIETTVSAVASNVTQEQLRELPLNGRNYMDLTLLQPGIVRNTRLIPNSTSTIGVYFSSNGAPVRSNNYMLDGALLTRMMDENNQRAEPLDAKTVTLQAIVASAVLRSGLSGLMVVRSARKASSPRTSNVAPASARAPATAYRTPSGISNCGPSGAMPHIAAAASAPTTGGGIR